MSVRPSLIGLALTMALGIGIYLGLTASDPALKPQPKSNPPNTKLDKTFPATAGASAATKSPPNTDPKDSQVQERLRLLDALKQVSRLPDGPDKRNQRRALLAQFIDLDPRMAMSYVDTLSGTEYAEQKEHAMSAWAKRDPSAAATYFRENGLRGGLTGEDDRLTAAAIAAEWATRDTQAAWSWVASLPEEARAEATAAIVSRLAKADPKAALQAINSLSADYERAEALHPLAQQWGQTAPLEAAAWIASLNQESEKNYAASGLVTGWMTISPRAASKWVSELPRGSTRDVAIAAMVQAQAAQKDPATATRWAASIQDPELRQQVLPQILERWQSHDPAAAQRWITVGK